MAGAIDDTIADLEPWIKEQVSAGIYSSYDYLMGRSQSLSLVISMEPMKESLKDNLRKPSCNHHHQSLPHCPQP